MFLATVCWSELYFYINITTSTLFIVLFYWYFLFSVCEYVSLAILLIWTSNHLFINESRQRKEYYFIIQYEGFFLLVSKTQIFYMFSILYRLCHIILFLNFCAYMLYLINFFLIVCNFVMYLMLTVFRMFSCFIFLYLYNGLNIL